MDLVIFMKEMLVESFGWPGMFGQADIDLNSALVDKAD